MTKKRKNEYKESFEIFAKCEAFYTSGKVQFTKNGESILSICGGHLKLFQMDGGKTSDAVENFEGEEINSFLLAEDDDTLITAAKNGIMRHWHLSTKTLEKTWKSVHVGLVSCMAFDSTTTLVATGGSDSTVKVWDIIQKYYTHNLKGGKGVFSKVLFQNIGSELHVFGSADDYTIHVWNLHTSEHVVALEGHYSTVTDLILLKENNQMLSCSRDKVVLLWDIVYLRLLKTIPVFETVEACMLLPESHSLSNLELNQNDTFFVTAGDKGILRVWSLESGKCVYEQNDSSIVLPKDSSYEGPLIVQATMIPSLEAIAVVTFEQNIVLYSWTDFSIKSQFVGYNDDVLSVKFVGSKDDQLAVATNSFHIKVFQLPTFSCQIFQGHQDIVLALDVFSSHKEIFVSGSKDNNVKVWDLNSDSACLNCVYTGFGHTDSVTAVCCCRGKSRFFASGSEDTTLKLWEIPETKSMVAIKQLLLAPYCTVKAHDKLINSIDISENDRFVASGSKDHTAKIWDTTELSLLGTLRGHKKGVWCVKFSPVDLALATSSEDNTIRIWSLVDFSCLKVFEGHEASVLQVLFVSRGTQLISSASDGNINLWNIKSNMSIKTLDAHDMKVWTLAASSSEEYVVSGGADSTIIVWKDTTQLERQREITGREDYVLQEQELFNLLRDEKWTKALGLAITLEKPFQAYNIIDEILRKYNETTLENILIEMRQDQKEALLKFSLEWITNSKTYYAAILIMNHFYRTFDSEELLKIPNMSTYIQQALPYLDRHFKRTKQRCQEMQIFNFLTRQIVHE